MTNQLDDYPKAWITDRGDYRLFGHAVGVRLAG